MENNFEQYETLLGCVSETAEACLDMEGGTFFLAWAGELIQDLAGKGYCRSARLTAQKLCEAVGADWAWPECDELEPKDTGLLVLWGPADRFLCSLFQRGSHLCISQAFLEHTL